MVRIEFEIRLSKLSNKLSESGYSLTEEAFLYDEQLKDLLQNAREYLDSLDFLPEYRVSWKDYKSTTPVTPYRFTKNGDKQIVL